jgi:hypothetical protein
MRNATLENQNLFVETITPTLTFGTMYVTVKRLKNCLLRAELII